MSERNAEPVGLPPGRYDRVNRLARRLPVPALAALVVAGLAALTVLAVVLGVRNTAPINAGVRSYAALSDSTVRLRLEVSKPAARGGSCLVRARGAQGLEVGRAEVDVPPDPIGREVTFVDYELATTSRAVSGEVLGCRLL